jgi:L-aspartate oxidase
MKTLKLDYLVIGSGIAGLSASNKLASTDCSVGVITKSISKEGSTQYAQGGIAVAMNEDDTTKYHFEDTLKAGAELCNKDAVSILVEEGPARVKELIELGANFDKIGQKYSFTKEAAHGKRRILHAGDATGKEIEKALGKHLKSQLNVNFYENTSVIQLIVEDNNCLGCLAVHNNELVLFEAKATIIATGGCAQVFARNTNPPVSTGDGIILGYDAGCDVQDMEFMQFHPTTLFLGDKKPISIFLISEAVRGEGGVLRNINGEQFMKNYHPDAELAPRDIVARSIFMEMSKTNSHVYLDLGGLKKDVKKRFPTIYERCLEARIDITRDFIPVAPAAHYFMGGLKTDGNGKTNVERLYAAGEVASLGLHGANRLASNSLLDGLVFGYRAAADALELDNSEVVIDLKKLDTENPAISESAAVKIMAAKQIIRKTMWHNVGIIRSKESLTEALITLKKLDWLYKLATFNLGVVEAKNMLKTSQLITKSALEREESRGAHFRADFPDRDNTNWKIHIVKNSRVI